MDSETVKKNAEMNTEGDIRNELQLDFNTAIPSQNPVDALSGLNKFLSESNNQENQKELNQEELKRLEKLLKLLLNN